MFGALNLNAACLHVQIKLCLHPVIHFMYNYWSLGLCKLLKQLVYIVCRRYMEAKTYGIVLCVFLLHLHCNELQF